MLLGSNANVNCALPSQLPLKPCNRLRSSVIPHSLPTAGLHACVTTRTRMRERQQDCAHHKRSLEVRCRGCCWTLAAHPWRGGLKRDLIQRSLPPEMVESALAMGHCNNVDVLSAGIGPWMTTASTSATPIERVIALGVTMTPIMLIATF